MKDNNIVLPPDAIGGVSITPPQGCEVDKVEVIDGVLAVTFKATWTKLFYLYTKEKVRQDKHYSFPVAYFKRITIEVGVNLHSIHLLPSFNIFWRGGYWSVSLDFLCAGFAVMVEDDCRVIVKEGGEE